MSAITVIETARLRLRGPRPSDFEAHAAFSASERSVGVGGPYSRADAFHNFCAMIGHWPMRGYGRWIVADKATDAPLGVVGPMFPEGWPEPEIAWTVYEKAEGKGIAFEAAAAARAHAYGALGWKTAVSLTDPGNLRSQALAKRMGCVRDGVFVHPEAGDLWIWRHPAPETLQ